MATDTVNKKVCRFSALANPRSHPGRAGPVDCSIMNSPTHQQHPVTTRPQRTSPRLPSCQLKRMFVRKHIRRRHSSTSSHSTVARKMRTSRTCNTAYWLEDCVLLEEAHRTSLDAGRTLASKPSSRESHLKHVMRFKPQSPHGLRRSRTRIKTLHAQKVDFID